MKDAAANHLLKQLRARKTALIETFAVDLSKASLFFMPFDTTDLNSETDIAALYADLKTHFSVEQKELTHEIIPLDMSVKVSSQTVLVAFFIINASGDIVSTVLKSFFAKHASNGITEQKLVRLSDFGVLLPRTCEIKCYSFAHGKGHYYRFRLAMHKLDTMPQPLLDFLLSLPSKCPNDFFSTGPRASNFDFNLHVDLTHLKSHPCIEYVKAAMSHRRFKSAHEDVEKYMIENDPECVATEVPLWLDSSEMNQYVQFQLPQGCLTGHIDVLRCEDDHIIGIWDFKPAAASAINAKVQVYLYAVMFAARTGISLDSIRCGYFDNEDAFLFKANQVSYD